MPVIRLGTPPNGFAPHQIGRNGALVSGTALSQLGRKLNAIAGLRLKTHFRRFIQPSDALDLEADSRTWSFYFHTSPNMKEVHIRTTYAPPENSDAMSPRAYWKLTKADASTVTQASVYDSRVAVTAASVFASQYSYAEQRIVSGIAVPPIPGPNLLPDTSYELELHTVDRMRVIGAVCFEVPDGYLNTDTAVIGVDPSVYGPGAHILDRDVNDLWDGAHTLWKRGGTPHFAWSVDNATGVSLTSATWTNPLDASTSGWGANAAGFYGWPYRRGSFSSTNVPVKCWAYCSNDAASTGAGVRFVNSTGTIATLTVTATAAMTLYTGTGNLTDSTTSEPVIIERQSDGTRTLKIHAAGMFEYQA